MRRALSLVLLLLAVPVASADTCPTGRTPNLCMKPTAQQLLNDNFNRIDEAVGAVLPVPWTPNTLGRIDAGVCRTSATPIVDAMMRVCSVSNSVHSFSVWSDNGSGTMWQRFVVENTAGGGGVTDIDFRNSTVNYGSNDGAVSFNAVQAFFFSPLDTASYDIIRAYDDGQGASGSKTLVIGNQGYITSFGRGKASQIFKICDFSDQSAANCRFILTEDGAMLWGGGTSQDVQLSRTAANTLRTGASDAIGAGPGDAPPTCGATTEGTMYYDASMDEPCYCNGTNWVTFDGSGGTPSSTSCG